MKRTLYSFFLILFSIKGHASDNIVADNLNQQEVNAFREELMLHISQNLFLHPESHVGHHFEPVRTHVQRAKQKEKKAKKNIRNKLNRIMKNYEVEGEELREDLSNMDDFMMRVKDEDKTAVFGIIENILKDEERLNNAKIETQRVSQIRNELSNSDARKDPFFDPEFMSMDRMLELFSGVVNSQEFRVRKRQDAETYHITGVFEDKQYIFTIRRDGNSFYARTGYPAKELSFYQLN